MKWYLARRLLWTVVAAYLVLSGAFLALWFAPPPSAMESGSAISVPNSVGSPSPVVDSSEPLRERYVAFLVKYATLDFDAETTERLTGSLSVTLAYLVPAFLAAVVGGTSVGLYAAMNPENPLGRLATLTAYVGVAVPSYWLAKWANVLAYEWFDWERRFAYDGGLAPWSAENLPLVALPFAVSLVGILAVQARYARSETAEHVHSEFVKTLRANGAKPRTIGRHVLKNAAVPLLSLLFVRTLTMLFVTVAVVEVVFGIPGFGSVALHAVRNRELDLVLAVTTVPVSLALLGNLVQDVAYTFLDPRVELGGR